MPQHLLGFGGLMNVCVTKRGEYPELIFEFGFSPGLCRFPAKKHGGTFGSVAERVDCRLLIRQHGCQAMFFVHCL